MRRLLLSIASVMAFGLMASAQTNGTTYPLNVDFESGAVVGFGTWDGGGATIASTVDNPTKAGINTSNKCLKYQITNKAIQGWWGVGSAMGGPIVWSAAGVNDTLKFMYLADTATSVKIHFENLEDYNKISGEITVDYTTPGAWQNLNFVFTDAAKKFVDTLTKLTIYATKTDFGVRSCYIDNIKGIKYKYKDVSVKATFYDKNAKLTAAPKAKFGAAGTLTAMTADGGNKYSITTGVKGYTLNDNISQETQVYFTTSADVAIDTIKGIIPNGGMFPLEKTYIYQKLIDDKGVMTINKITTPPTIDGNPADWTYANVASHDVTHAVGTADADFGTTFKMAWDENNIYLLNIVKDKHVESGNATNWQNDCVETFFSMDLTDLAAGAYDVNDWQIRYEWNRTRYTGSANTEASATIATDITRAFTTQHTATDTSGYTMEWAVPFTFLDPNFVAAKGAQFKWEEQVADSRGGSRKCQYFWNSTADGAYADTRKLGIVTLGESSAISTPTATTTSLYPNPVVNTLKVSNTVKSIVVTNLIGAELLRSTNVNSLDLTGLNSGIYVVTITDNNGSVSNHKIIKR